MDNDLYIEYSKIWDFIKSGKHFSVEYATHSPSKGTGGQYKKVKTAQLLSFFQDRGHERSNIVGDKKKKSLSYKAPERHTRENDLVKCIDLTTDKIFTMNVRYILKFEGYESIY